MTYVANTKKKLNDKNVIITELIKKVKELTIELASYKSILTNDVK